MKKVLKSTGNTSVFKKFLIPKNEDDKNYDWVEISIDYTNKIFTAKKIEILNINEGWEEYRDHTFPSSLLNEFLNS
ncbi:hypothetical protein BH10BAC2_BH10BAC2_25240 [soil metagenome]